GVVADEGAGRPRALFLAGDTGAPSREGKETSLLLIDGNRNGHGVLFDHDAHVQRLGGDASCGTCHHLNMPLEQATSCAACHRDMYASTSLFDHASHVKAVGGNAGCAECHEPGAAVKTYATATACMDCHQDQADSAFVGPPHARWQAAEGYMEAMHGLCVECHKREVADHPGRYPASLDQCSNCHDADVPLRLKQLEPAPSHSAAPGKVTADAVTAARAPAGVASARRGSNANTGESGP
ncbi:MAG: cytochrome c3 family protein, partial [Gemmatimonadota bacterium]